MIQCPANTQCLQGMLSIFINLTRDQLMYHYLQAICADFYLMSMYIRNDKFGNEGSGNVNIGITKSEMSEFEMIYSEGF